MSINELPTKLGAAVAEYLRQREAGVLSGHWQVSGHVAQLLRAASQSGGDSTLKLAVKVLSRDRDTSLAVGALLQSFERASEKGELAGWLEEVRNVRCEIREQLAAAAGGGRTVYWACADTAGVCEGGGEPLDDVTLASKMLVGAERLVVAAQVVHKKHGACCASGADIVVAAARRQGVPVVLAVASFGIGVDEEVVPFPRAQPGKLRTEIMDNADVVLRTRCWVPLSDVNVIVTDSGGFSPTYLMS